jgi:hypothetical protein
MGEESRALVPGSKVPPVGGLSGRALAVIVLLVLDALITGGLVVARLGEIDLLQRIGHAPQSVTVAEATASDARIDALAKAHLAVFIVTAIAFLVWLYAASKRAHNLGAFDMRFSPAAGVGWFFVPIANLFQPFRAISEIWKVSDPSIDRASPAAWQDAPVSALLPIWWVGYIGTNIVSRLIPSSLSGSEGLQQLTTISQLAAGVSAGIAISAVLACIVIVFIENRLRSSEAAGPFVPAGGATVPG